MASPRAHPERDADSVGRALLALLFGGSGVLHLLMPAPYLSIMPDYLPAHGPLVAVSGVAELGGAAGLLWPQTRRVAGRGLLVLLAAVLPANVQMLIDYRESGAPPLAVAMLWLRLPLQPLLMWWVWRVSLRSDVADSP